MYQDSDAFKTRKGKGNGSLIIYTCDSCHVNIPIYYKRVKCLECDNTDLCMDCFDKHTEMKNHKSIHHVIIIPELSDEISVIIPAEPENADEMQLYKDIDDVETDVENNDDDPTILLTEYTHSTDDKREFVSVIDSTLALEILDGLCYFQFDFDGLSRSLSKRISQELLHSYIYDCVLQIPDYMEKPPKVINPHLEEEIVDEIPVIQYSWDVPFEEAAEEDITQETFSPTVLEHMIRYMTVESCNIDVLICLKGVEPILHAYKPLLFDKVQLLSLLTCTMTHKALLPLKAKLISLQRKLDPRIVILDPSNYEQKSRLVMQFARKTLYLLPPKEMMIKKCKKKQSKRKGSTKLKEI